MHFVTASNPFIRILLVGSLAALFSACSSTPKQETMKQTSEPAMNISLTHTQWVAEKIFGNAADAAESTVSFPEEGKVGGSTGCNNYTGSVTIELTSIDFGLLATTRMMCAPAISGQETLFLEALEITSSWQRIGSTLIFLDKNGETVMTLIAAAAAD